MTTKDAIVTLKIDIVATNNQKAMRFGLDLSVGEVIKEIRLKNEIGGKDHGLFMAGNLETGKKVRLAAAVPTMAFLRFGCFPFSLDLPPLPRSSSIETRLISSI